jgi:hypothetical protein
MKTNEELIAENAKLRFLLDLAMESLYVSEEALSIAKNTCAGNSANFTTAIASVMDTMKKINHHNRTHYEQ